MRKRHDTILAIDPGLRELGYAILAGPRLVTSGVLPLRTVQPRRRLGIVREAIGAWWRAYHPNAFIIENVPNGPLASAPGLPALGQLLRRLASIRRLKLASYSAKAVRKSVVGNGWAGKREVAETISVRYPELRVHLKQATKSRQNHWANMFDAIALGLHHQTISKPPSRSRFSD